MLDCFLDKWICTRTEGGDALLRSDVFLVIREDVGCLAACLGQNGGKLGGAWIRYG